MILFLILVSIIAFLAYYYLKPELKPRFTTFEFKPQTSDSSAVYRRTGLTGDFPTTLPNKLDESKPLRTLYEVFEYAAEKYANEDCLGVRNTVKIHSEKVTVDGREKTFTFPELGPYQWKTYKEVRADVINAGSGLRNIGMQPGDFLAIFEDTCYEWTVLSRAAFTQSVTIFTVYANLGEEALIYALNEGEIKYIMANGSLVNTLINIKHQVPSLEYVVINGHPSDEIVGKCEKEGLHIITVDDLIADGKKNPVEAVPPSPEDLALIMYTSGSTGVPKGVMTSHRNIVSACASALPVITIEHDDRILHYLPLAHSMANMIESLALYNGVCMGYGSPRTLSAKGVRNCEGDLKEMQPTILIAVPTIFEKIKHSVVALVEQKGPISKFMFNLALKHKLKALKNGSSGAIWDKLVFGKIRTVFGVQNLKYMVTGSAPLSGKIQDFSRALFGCPLIQGYGLTETCSSGTAQDFQDFDNFVCGIPTGAAELKLVDVPDMEYFHTDAPNPRGEIWIRGPVITNGYYKNEKKTNEEFHEDPDGDSPYKWFATGDIGMVNERGSFQIIDRKKNLIKASHGEYIALEKLESAYRNCSWLDTLVVYVDGLHYHCVVVGVPNRERLTAFAKDNGIDISDFADICKDEKVRKMVLKDLETIGRQRGFKSIEIIRGLYLSPEEWTPENNMLTAAMKLNRTQIIKAFFSEIEEIYYSLEE